MAGMAGGGNPSSFFIPPFMPNKILIGSFFGNKPDAQINLEQVLFDSSLSNTPNLRFMKHRKVRSAMHKNHKDLFFGTPISRNRREFFQAQLVDRPKECGRHY